jgi:hypothetical protein
MNLTFSKTLIVARGSPLASPNLQNSCFGMVSTNHAIHWIWLDLTFEESVIDDESVQRLFRILFGTWEQEMSFGDQGVFCQLIWCIWFTFTVVVLRVGDVCLSFCLQYSYFRRRINETWLLSLAPSSWFESNCGMLGVLYDLYFLFRNERSISSSTSISLRSI